MENETKITDETAITSNGVLSSRLFLLEQTTGSIWETHSSGAKINWCGANEIKTNGR